MKQMITFEGIQASGKSTVSEYLAELLELPFVRFGTPYTGIYEELVSKDGNYKRFDIVSLFRRLLTIKCAQFDGLRFYLEEYFVTNEYYHAMHHLFDIDESDQFQALTLIKDIIEYGNVQHEAIVFYLYIPKLISMSRVLSKRSGESVVHDFSDSELSDFEKVDSSTKGMLNLATQIIPNFYVLDNSGDMNVVVDEVLSILKENHGFQC